MIPTDPTYQEMQQFIIAQGCPIDAYDLIDEGIYWFAKQHGREGTNIANAVNLCRFKPGPSDLVLSSESVAALVYEMLETEYLKPTSKQLACLLHGSLLNELKEDKDLYDG